MARHPGDGRLVRYDDFNLHHRGVLELTGDDIDYELRNLWGPVAALMWEF